MQVVLDLKDFDLLGPNEQNKFKVTNYEREAYENVVNYQVQASTKLGAAVGVDGALTQVVGPDVRRRYKKPTSPPRYGLIMSLNSPQSTPPERVTIENILLDLIQPKDWLQIRNEVNKILNLSSWRRITEAR